MAGKKKVEKQTASLVGGVGAQSRKIWLAGLGAYARSGSDGRDAFDALVLEGKQVEEAQLAAAKQALAANAPTSVSPTAKAKASPGNAAPAASKAKAKPVAPLASALPKTEGAETLVEKAVALNAANAKPAKKAAKTKSAVDEAGAGEKKPKARKAAAKP